MPIIAAIIAAILGFAWWQGKLTLRQIPAILLMIAGAGLMSRGSFLYGLGAVAIGAIWFSGRMIGRGKAKTLSQEDQMKRDIADARLTLGVSAHDDADAIRARHRALMTQNHPDTGGSKERAQQLNAARDLLLANLELKQ